MSVHRDCGENIHWMHREDDPERFMPPMEFAGQAYVIEGGIATEVSTYRMHRCDPVKVVAWQEYIQTMAELKGPNSFESEINLYQAARLREREEAWAIAMTVDCDKCSAVVDEKCYSRAQHHVKSGELVETTNPHPSRLERGYMKKKEATP